MSAKVQALDRVLQALSPALVQELDRVVQEIISRLRRGESAPLPGLGSFSGKPGGKISFRREGGRRRG